MRELEVYNLIDLPDAKKKNSTLLVCDESAITCVTFRQLQLSLSANGGEVTLAMPDYEYQKGKRGWAKAHILASVAPQINGILPLSYEEAIKEIEDNHWGKVQINGKPGWSSNNSISSEKKPKTSLRIEETTDIFDNDMLAKISTKIETSNCWLDPAGVIFTQGTNILMESVSTSFNNSHCHDIPINFRELPLEEGERMVFCDSLHAERVGISEAAKEGTSLVGSTMYVSKFPCRPCAQSAIAAGVKTIVFERGSYGLLETADLFEENEIVLKRIINQQ